MSPAARRRVAQFLAVLSWGTAISAVMGAASGAAFRDAPLLGAAQGGGAGAINAVIVIGAIFGAEIFLPATRFGRALERARFYHGDVMNTTSRLEQATRDLGRQFLVSRDALDRVDSREPFALEDLGPQRLRGPTRDA